MHTFRDLVYMILDELKLFSDDSNFTEEHIILLLVKYRAILLKRRYSDPRKIVSEDNYQEVYLNLIEVPAISGIPCEGGVFLRSEERIPSLMPFGVKRVYTSHYYNGEISLVSKDRMRYTGYNKYLSNIVYCSIGPDNYLYFKFNNNDFLNTENIYLYGVFQDCAAASDLQLGVNNELLDRVFPIEDYLVPPLIEMIIKTLTSAIYRPEDNINDAKDNLSEVNIKK